MIFAVEVGVSLGRPPRHDRTIYTLLEAESAADARLLAYQWATWHPAIFMVGMVVSAEVVPMPCPER